MHSRRIARLANKMFRILATCLLCSTFALGGCWDSDIGKRFRESYGSGFTTGLTTIFSAPGQVEDGLRQMGVALAQGLGAIVEPRTSSSSGSSGSSSSSSSSSSSG